MYRTFKGQELVPFAVLLDFFHHRFKQKIKNPGLIINSVRRRCFELPLNVYFS